MDSITQIDKEAFDGLMLNEYPFMKYEFFALLESSHSVGGESGWKVNHLLILDKNQLIGFMPFFIKQHSYGEYVFDFQWAKAYQDNGLNYYPKAVSAIPFTPVIGPRVLIHPDYDLDQIAPILIQTLMVEAENRGLSSWHLLFPEPMQQQIICNSHEQLLRQKGVQFHWYNQGYKTFADFLAKLNKKRRKEIRRERHKIQENTINFSVKEGSDISQSDWEDFYLFYQMTYMKRSGHGGYLTPTFFSQLSEIMPQNIVLIMAESHQQNIAAALFFKDNHTLYGRYWGTTQFTHHLHFETCYYQGIEYCIKNNLEHFDAGAQGEHKIQRGFIPVKTYSSHWIAHEDFRDAIGHHLNTENQYTERYFQAAKDHSPYKMD